MSSFQILKKVTYYPYTKNMHKNYYYSMYDNINLPDKPEYVPNQGSSENAQALRQTNLRLC